MLAPLERLFDEKDKFVKKTRINLLNLFVGYRDTNLARSFPKIIKTVMSLRFLGVLIALLGTFGVGLGAFGAHALKAQLLATGQLDNWRTAVSYQLIHAVAGLALWALLHAAERAPQPKLLRAALACWISGVVLFSGSIYGLCLGGPHWLGPVTPLGGLALMAGWICVLVASISKKNA